MKYYLKHCLPQNPSHFILHIGAADMKSDQPSKAIVKEIMKLAVSLKSEVNDVSVSNIIVCTDNQQLNLKAIKVNGHLVGFCQENNFSLVDNLKRGKEQHLNNRRLHLNKNGSKFLSDVYCKEIVKIFK